MGLRRLDWTDKQRQRRAVAEYLAAIEAEAETKAKSEPEGGDGSGGDPTSMPDRKAPKVISPSDPSSAWTAKANKRVQFGYGLNYLIDNEHAIIVDVEATPARTYDEVAATRAMIDRTQKCFDLKPKRLAADTAYGTSRFLGWLVKEKRITPHIPVWDRSGRDDGTFSSDDFIYDAERDLYVCPSGKVLRSTGTLHSDNTYRYVSKRADCDQCPLKPRCCRKQPERRILRDPNEAARDYARSLANTPAFEQSSRERKKVAMRFAHFKTHHGFERMRLRGLSGARDEFHLAAIVQNLKTLALRLVRPPPEPAYA
jgi:hypothetical protein